MSNRITKGIALAGGLSVDSRTGFQLGSSTLRLRSYTKSISITAAGSTTEQDSGYDLPAKSVVDGVSVLIQTASSSAGTMHVGLLASSSGGDADGFLAGISTTGTGIKLGGVTTSTSGAVARFFASNTLGVLLSDYAVGSTAAGDFGLFAQKRHASDSVTAKSVTWTINSTGTAVVGEIYIHITELTT